MTDELIAADILRMLVDAADKAGLANIRARLGGPFGSILNLADIKTGKLTPILEPQGNRVLTTALPTAHAEDQAMGPAYVKELRHMLRRQGAENSLVIVASSAESCAACHAKAEILSRILTDDRLLAPGRFMIVFGASVRDTKEVAGLNDEPYLNDIMGPPENRLIKTTAVARDSVPPDILRLMGRDRAVIAMPDGRLFDGADERGKHFILIPEVGAIHAACTEQKRARKTQPWNLDGAALYSFTPDPGPLAYTACQWANVQKWVAVVGGKPVQEAPGIGNDALFRAVAQRPYNGLGTAVRIVHIQPFANLTQKEWRDTLAAGGTTLENYNGIETGT
jgi:tRNA(Arg) A34 adenosine deaminase TadA